MRAYPFLIFDLDGTLVDSAPDIIATVNALMRSRGKPELPPERIRRAIGEGLRALVYGLFDEAKRDPLALAEIESEFMAHYEAHLLRNTTVYPGVADFLSSWRGSAAIVTNKNERFAKRTVAELEIGRFDWTGIYGADSFARKKPDPLPLLEAMKAAGASPEGTIMIGDGIPDMQAAARAGVPAIAIGFGYAPLDRLNEAGAAAVIASFAELPDTIGALASRARSKQEIGIRTTPTFS